MLEQVDWSRAWFAPVRALACPADDWLTVLSARAAQRDVRNHEGQLISFVPQSALPAGESYAAFIGHTGQVPSRDNLHDYFNALSWLAYPRIKRELGHLHSAQIAESGVGQVRGPTRDAATIYDENAALLVVSPAGQPVVEALRRHDWVEALYEQRAKWGTELALWTFGHALMEKLVAPRKAITAHVRVLAAPAEFFSWTDLAQLAWIDAAGAQELAGGLDASWFTPLQALGVPGWWPGQDVDFYSDKTVFRPRKS